MRIMSPPLLTSPSSVFSIRPFTTLACSGSLSLTKKAVTIGVLMVLEALMISFIRGTPRVIFVIELKKIHINILNPIVL